MNILVVHEVSYMEKPVYEYQDFSERFASLGHNVTVIDFVENGLFEANEQTVSRTGVAEVTLCSIPHSSFPAIKYAQAQLAYVRMLKKIIIEKKIDIIFLYSVFINGMSTVKMARKRGIPVIYRAIDIYHKLRPGTVVQYLLKLGESYIYNRADRILATNEKMAEYVQKYLKNERNKPTVLDHGVDTGHFAPVMKNTGLMNHFGFHDDDEIVVFLGTTYSFSRLDEFVAMLPVYLMKRPRFRLLIVGAGELDDTIRRVIVSNAMETVVIQAGMIDYHDLPAYLSMAVLAINTFSINDVTRDIVPIKILQYLASALPVVSTPLPDVCRKVPETESGIFYSKTETLADVFGKIDELLEDRTILAEASRRARDYSLMHLSIDRTVSGLMKNLNELVKK